ncbi:hypothetical protein KKJ24_13695, partial [Xenorhabdus bovienii]|nr:hypothetical protein [Xenorhabdus bovienii]
AVIRPDIELQPTVDVRVIFVLQTGCVHIEHDVMTYKMDNGRKIHLNVLYEKNFLTHWNGGKNQDADTSMTYPDGTIIYNGDVIPDFDKLMRILESRNSKQTKM